MESEDDSETLAPTIQARLTAILRRPGGEALAATLVEHPGTTIRPSEHVSSSLQGNGAVQALRALGASLSKKIELHQTLGEGGMGLVRLATQVTVGRHVAVKTVRPEVAASEDATLRILREAWVTGALEHPNVVPIYDVGIDEAGAPVIVMKRIEGESWSTFLYAPERVAERFPAVDPHDFHLGILEDVCNAVHFAHCRGILHRDLKPENVMIGAFGEVYVLDWGIAVSLSGRGEGRLPLAAAATDIAGTPHYMAPEMLLADPTKLGPRTDVYLLGAILYEIFAKSPPHEGADLNALVTHILTSPIDFPDEVPAEVRAICKQAMSRDPASRHESAEAFRVAVRDYVRHRGSRKLATEAKKSHELLEAALLGPAGDDRDQEVARLLGECRFGYRAALSAWSENEEARVGLDAALVSVARYSLEAGALGECETLLREVKDKPAELVQRASAAQKARADNDARLHRMEADLDASVGTRTRTAIGGIFGALWTASPMAWWLYLRRHDADEPALFGAVAPLVFLALAGVAFAWGRESLTKTQVNRRLSATVSLYLLGQSLLAVGGHVAGMSPHLVRLMMLFAWSLLHGLLAIWVARWFAVVALTCLASFFVAAAAPTLTFPVMSLDNLVLTVVLVLRWLPDEDYRRLQERKAALLRRMS